MIVICTKCQAKFRVADDKIGPRGAKVRCSRCRTVFVVGPDTGPAQAVEPAPPAVEGVTAQRAHAEEVDLDITGARATAVSSEDPFASNPALAPPPQASAAAAALLASLPPPLPDTRAAPPPLPASEASAADPFAAAGLGEALALPGDPPFAQPQDFAPFAAPAPDAAPSAGGSTALPLTDLSDLLGSHAAGSPDGGTAEAEPAPPPVSATPADDGGLSLEDRLTPPPFAVGGSDPFASADPGPLPGIETAAPALSAGPEGDPFSPAAAGAGFGGAGAEPLPGDEALSLAYDLSAPPPAHEAAPPPPVAHPKPQPALAAQEAPQGDERIPGGRASHLRSVAVNAVALAALLVVALAILAVWRSEGRFEASMLRPSALVAALRSGHAPGPFAVTDVRSGLYERDRGAPLLFVSGDVAWRAAAPVRGVRVAVEVVREGRVIARGAALAGAVPTPEELWTADDAEALEALARETAKRAPAEVRPGDRVPFLVSIGDHPADLDDASLRFDVTPAQGTAP